MPISQARAIVRLYQEVLSNGITVEENQSIEDITKSCEKKGQFIFRGDSYWSFVQTKSNARKCVRMIFALKENSGGKVHNIDRIMELIGNVEKTLTFIDNHNYSAAPLAMLLRSRQHHGGSARVRNGVASYARRPGFALFPRLPAPEVRRGAHRRSLRCEGSYNSGKLVSPSCTSLHAAFQQCLKQDPDWINMVETVIAIFLHMHEYYDKSIAMCTRVLERIDKEFGRVDLTAEALLRWPEATGSKSSGQGGDQKKDRNSFHPCGGWRGPDILSVLARPFAIPTSLE